MDKPLSLNWIPGIANIGKNAWNALAVPMETPLLEWDWLKAFEESGSMAPDRGWLPYHLTVTSNKSLLAAAPLYIKGHSEGEFVWDYTWADVASQLGIAYYPKLIGMSPATPAPGYRFLIDPAEDEELLTELMLNEIDRFCAANKLSGCSFNFVDPRWKDFLVSRGYTKWLHQGFEWRNQSFSNFDGYLMSFSKNQRKNIRKERARVRDGGVEVVPFTGEEIPNSLFPLLYEYYKNTNDQFGPWAAKFLNREFFEELNPGFRDRLLFMAAFEKGEDTAPVGISLLLAKAGRLIGRYWGASKWLDSLHFEACYYAPIEWAIEHGYESFDPGMGSPHKLRRGFRAVGNYSLHRFQDERMRKVMDRYIGEINEAEERKIEAMNATLPLKAD